MTSATIRALTKSALNVAGGLQTFTLTRQNPIVDVRDGTGIGAAETAITVSGREIAAKTGERSAGKSFLLLGDLVAQGGRPDRAWWLTGADGVQRRVAPDPEASIEHMTADGRAWTVVHQIEGAPSA